MRPQPTGYRLRVEVYLTNAVKPFRYTRQGKRQLHRKPDVAHIRAWSPWLTAERAAVRPQVVVVRGAVAARSLFGASYRVTEQHGEPVELDDGIVAVGTICPIAVLRADDRDAAYDGLVADLRAAAAVAGSRRRR